MLSRESSLREYYSQTIASQDFESARFFKFGELVFEIRSNSQQLLNELDRYFVEFGCEPTNAAKTIIACDGVPPRLNENDVVVKQPDTGKKKIKEEYINCSDGRIVRKRLTGMMMIFGEDFHLAIGPCLENSNQVINFINNRLIQDRLEKGYLLGHAAALAANGKALSIAGQSGMGKSTLSLHVMNLGVNFISNDRVMVKNFNGKVDMMGVPKHPRVNPGTLINNEKLSHIVSDDNMARYRAMSKDDLWDLEEKYDVIIGECYGRGKFKLQHQMHHLILLNWHRDNKGLKIEKIDVSRRRDLLPSFMKETGLFYNPLNTGPSDPGQEDYIKHLQAVDVYELSGEADFAKAADFCLQLLK